MGYGLFRWGSDTQECARFTRGKWVLSLIVRGRAWKNRLSDRIFQFVSEFQAGLVRRCAGFVCHDGLLVCRGGDSEWDTSLHGRCMDGG